MWCYYIESFRETLNACECVSSGSSSSVSTWRKADGTVGNDSISKIRWIERGSLPPPQRQIYRALLFSSNFLQAETSSLTVSTCYPLFWEYALVSVSGRVTVLHRPWENITNNYRSSMHIIICTGFVLYLSTLRVHDIQYKEKDCWTLPTPSCSTSSLLSSRIKKKQLTLSFDGYLVNKSSVAQVSFYYFKNFFWEYYFLCATLIFIFLCFYFYSTRWPGTAARS